MRPRRTETEGFLGNGPSRPAWRASVDLPDPLGPAAPRANGRGVDRVGQLMGLAWRQDEGHRASEPISDHASLGPIAPHASGPALYGCPAQLECPFSGRSGRFLMRPDAGAVQKRHPKLDPTLLGQTQHLVNHLSGLLD